MHEVSPLRGSSLEGAEGPVVMPAAARSHALAAREVARLLGSDERRGLDELEAARRFAENGPNQLSRRERPQYLALAARQFLDPLVALLLAAVGVSAAIGDELEAGAIAAIVALNAILGFAQEAAAERAVLALREVFTQAANVIRDGREQEIPAAGVVPGDLLVLREGERVSADARLVSAERLASDESALTGESLPVAKSLAPVGAETPLAERTSMVFAGSAVTRGRATALVTATGDATELGAISELAAGAERPPTPLQRRLGRLARVMVLFGVAVTVLLAAGMLLRGSSLHDAFLVGVAVAVAAVPEGLTATVTIALALGARAMAKRGAIVRRLSAIETIGETTIVCTDKTGTLTENRLRLADALPALGVGERDLLAGAVLASSAELIETDDGSGRVVGDPVEGALLLAAQERGLAHESLLAGRTHIYELPFEPEAKRMTVVYQEPDGRRAFTKGAPEVLLDRSTVSPVEKDRLALVARAWAEDGLRVLAVGERRLPEDAELAEDLDQELVILGLVALHDPLRAAAPAAIEEARAAGVKVQMLTGDHLETARAIGRTLGFAEGDVFARVTPRDKLRLVEELQASGEIVAVTGDGVNDAPALRRADVGIAMGLSGTEAAREASSIVLTDDDFATIVVAIREGRRIVDNVRKVVSFLLSANLGEIVLFGIAVLAGLGAPMTVVQVLAVNVLTDGLPALAIARDPASQETMALGPRRRLFTVPLALGLAGVGILVGVAGLGSYLAGRSLGGGVAQTMAFATIALAELVVVFSCRSVLQPAWRMPWNPHLAAAVGASVLLLGLLVYVPVLHEPFGTVSLGTAELGIVFALAFGPAALVELAKAVARRRTDGRVLLNGSP